MHAYHLVRTTGCRKKTTSLLFACRLYSWCNDRSLKLLLNWFEIHLQIYEDSVKKKLNATESYTHFFPVLVSFVFLPFFRNFTIGWCFSHIFPSFSSFSCPSLSFSFSFQCSSISFVRVHLLHPRPSSSPASISFVLVHLFLHQPYSFTIFFGHNSNISAKNVCEFNRCY